jgi:hypothetical protein
MPQGECILCIECWLGEKLGDMCVFGEMQSNKVCQDILFHM